MVALSPIGGAGWQFFDSNGDPLSGGKLYTYAAGTTTPLASYTSSSGATPNANPIILDSAGRVTNQIWLTDTAEYKFALYSATDVLIWTKDNIPGMAAADVLGDYVTYVDLSGTAPGEGAGLVGTTLGVTQEDVNDSLIMMAPWIGATGDGTTNDATAINTYLATKTRLHFPARIGTQATSRYAISSPILITQNNTHISFDKGARLVPTAGSTPANGIRIAGAAPTAFVNLSADALNGRNTFTLATDPGWVVNDWVELRSEALITGCPNTQGNKESCIRKITARSGAGPVTFTVNKELPYTFAVADTARAGLATVIENILIDCAQINDEEFGTSLILDQIDLRYCAYVTIINPSGFGSKVPYGPDNAAGNFIKINSCFNVEIRNPIARHQAYYGVAILGCAEDVRCYGGSMEDVRHAVSVVWGDPVFSPYGQAINVLIDGMTASFTSLSGFDTHDTGRDIRFTNCVSESAGDDGFQARTTNVSYNQCVARYSLRDGFSQGPGASGTTAVNCVSAQNGRIGVNWNYDIGFWVGGRVSSNGSADARAGLQPGGGPAFLMTGGAISDTWIVANRGLAAIVHGQVRATFTGDISGTTLTVASALSGSLTVGDAIASATGSTVAAGTVIVSQLSGTTGGIGTYEVNINQIVASSSLVAGSGQIGLLVQGCTIPADATQTSLAGVPAQYDLALLTLRDNDISGYGDEMFATSTGTIKSIAPVTSGNQVTSAGALRSGRVTLVAGAATVANTAIRNKASAAFYEAITCSVELRRPVAGGTTGALYIDTITDQTSFVIRSTSALDTSTVVWDMSL